MIYDIQEVCAQTDTQEANAQADTEKEANADREEEDTHAAPGEKIPPPQTVP